MFEVTYRVPTGRCGAMAARLSSKQKVAGSSPVSVILLLPIVPRSCFRGRELDSRFNNVSYRRSLVDSIPLQSSPPTTTHIEHLVFFFSPCETCAVEGSISRPPVASHHRLDQHRSTIYSFYTTNNEDKKGAIRLLISLLSACTCFTIRRFHRSGNVYAPSNIIMSRQINQPINQVRLTNVAVVRMNQGGKRFEIACYRNKVVNYRQGLEQDLSEVLQTERIFTNVSKGQFAKAKDLQKAFGTKDEDEIAKLILNKGQLQVSDKERSQQLEKTTAQIADWVSKNCVHADSTTSSTDNNNNRPFTIPQIRHAMQHANFSVHPTKPLKRQYLECVKLLQSIIPIQRAKMELALYFPKEAKLQETVVQTLKEHNAVWSSITPTIADSGGADANADAPADTDDQGHATSTSPSEQFQYKVQVDPSMYRVLNDMMQTIPKGRIEIITQVLTQEGDTDLGASADNYLVSLGMDDDDVDGHADDDDDDDDIVAYSTTTKVIGKRNKSAKISKKKTVDDDDDDDDDDDSEEADDIVKAEKSQSDSDEEELLSGANRRKSQKQARKKHIKVKRREDDESLLDPEERKAAMTTSTLVTKACTPGATTNSSVNPGTTSSSAGGPDEKSCNTCGGSFGAADFRAHFKSDWHRFNQKLKLKGATPISEQEFLLCDSDALFTPDI
jgi:ribosome maturation protein SDO1